MGASAQNSNRFVGESRRGRRSKPRSVGASKLTSIDPSESAILARTSRGAGARCTRTTCGDVTVSPGNVAVTEYVPGTRGIKPDERPSTRPGHRAVPTHASKPRALHRRRHRRFQGDVRVDHGVTPRVPRVDDQAERVGPTGSRDEDDPDGLIFEFIPLASPATTFNDVRDPTRAPPGNETRRRRIYPRPRWRSPGWRRRIDRHRPSRRPSGSAAAGVKVEPPDGSPAALERDITRRVRVTPRISGAILTTSVSPAA